MNNNLNNQNTYFCSMQQKILELFEYRKLPVLLTRGDYTMDSLLVKNLIELQLRIYELDTYLETVWKTKDSALKKYWKNIEYNI